MGLRPLAAAVLAGLATLPGCASAPVAEPASRFDDDRHYFVRVFGGFFPVPTRYELVNYGDGRARMVSPPTLSVVSAARPNEIGAVSSISIIDRPCPDHSADARYRTVESGERSGLAYKVFSVVSLDLETFGETVEISDGAQCMVILGENLGFWRQSLARYGEVAEAIKAAEK